MIEHWKKELLIGTDSLVRNDNSVVLLNCYSVTSESEKLHFCFPICDTTTDSLSKYDEDIWTSFQIFCETSTDKYTFVGGEGAMGNEGFLACLDGNKEPIWTLFFVNSNPFYELEVKDQVLEAVTSLDQKFFVDLASPERVKIIHFEWR